MKKKIYTAIFFLIFVFFTIMIARDFRPDEIPNGDVNNCANCHINPLGGGERNAFGQEVENGFLSAPGAAGHVQWGSDLAGIDSDNDGFTNGEELQDPSGSWTGGAIGDRGAVTNPGDPDSHPEVTSVELRDGLTVPLEYSLEQNYPNPFNPSTTINFSITQQDHVTLRIYNSLGQVVEELINQTLPLGNYNVQWRAVNVSSGVYFYTLVTSGFTQSKKMILLR